MTPDRVTRRQSGSSGRYTRHPAAYLGPGPPLQWLRRGGQRPGELLDPAGQGISKSVITGTSGSVRPPRASGTLSPAQAAAAIEVVRAFWLTLGRNDAHAAAQAVLPAQRTCFRSMMGGRHLSVTSLAIISAQPAGNTAATVRFTVSARATLDGQRIPVLAGRPGRTQWLVTTEADGHWYVDLGRSSSLVFGPACK
jgi:hypothetical protein